MGVPPMLWVPPGVPTAPEMPPPFYSSPEPACEGDLLAMHVRACTPDDAPVLAELYRDAARGLASHAYSAAQIDAWASYADDFTEFSNRLERGLALVSLEGDAIAAFGQLDPDDYVSLLYTATRFARRGHATAIYQRLEAAARERGVARLGTTASRLSRPFFARHGFELIAVEQNVYKGIEFERFKMAKPLGPVG